MHFKLLAIIASLVFLLAGTGLSDGCYDPKKYPAKFSDMGTNESLFDAINSTCVWPIAEKKYGINGAGHVNINIPNNYSHSITYHFAGLHHHGQNLSDPNATVYFSKWDCDMAALQAIWECDHGGEVNVTVYSMDNWEGPLDAWVQVIPYANH
ncbi:hypothetical protein VP1G_02982 [Cytospora mali]|uniref:Uncharacterized protein n=1 Tax=Cytospora mali TaxID=578113 RepID=A0A194UVH5_CYTMA|nr:hypothetical protein VP1G_02982 [Valsa mali var. pyri (nom. inval.)]